MVLMGDVNDDVIGNNPTTRSSQELNMRDVVADRHPKLAGVPTFHDGKRSGTKQVDIIAATPEIWASSATWLSIHNSPGDHLSAIVEIKWKVLVGKEVLRIARPEIRRLTTKIPKVTKKHVTHVEKQAREHKTQ